MLSVVPEPAGDDGAARAGGVELGVSSSLLDDHVKEGARRMLAEALEAEVAATIARLAE